MVDYEEIMRMFNLEDEKVYFNNKGIAKANEVIITEDYTWSEAAGMLYGSEFEGYIVLREGQELTEEEYEKITFKYEDKIERYSEGGEKYERNNKNCNYINEGINLTGTEVYILYANYNNNSIDSYNVDIYRIK